MDNPKELKRLSAWKEKFMAHANEIRACEDGEQSWTYNPGDHCRWCAGQAICKAHVDKMTTDAKLDFAPVKPESVFVPPKVETLSDEQIVRIIKHREEIESYLKRVEEYAISRSEEGSPVGGTKVVRGRSTRRWQDKGSHTAEQLVTLGVKDPYERKLKGITLIEREIGKGKVDHLTVKPEGKPKLTLEDDPRPAINEDLDSVAAEFSDKPY